MEKKNQYYIVREGTKIIYKGKDENKAKMLEKHLAGIEDSKEKAKYNTYSQKRVIQ